MKPQKCAMTRSDGQIRPSKIGSVQQELVAKASNYCLSFCYMLSVAGHAQAGVAYLNELLHFIPDPVALGRDMV